MINIWQYKDSEKLRITTTDNKVFWGKVIELIDEGERSDIERQEDSIVLRTSNQEVELYVSEIKSIEVA